MKKIDLKDFEKITKLREELNVAKEELLTFVIVEKNIKKKIIDLVTKQDEIKIEFNKKYGDVTIDLSNGNISKPKSEPKKKK